MATPNGTRQSGQIADGEADGRSAMRRPRYGLTLRGKVSAETAVGTVQRPQVRGVEVDGRLLHQMNRHVYAVGCGVGHLLIMGAEVDQPPKQCGYPAPPGSPRQMQRRVSTMRSVASQERWAT
jgi:hypothetical protein